MATDPFSAARKIADDVTTTLARGDVSHTKSHLTKLKAALARLPDSTNPEQELARAHLDHTFHFATAATAWMKKQFPASRAAAILANVAEDQLWNLREHAKDQGECARSDAAWVLISALSDGGERREAVTVSRAILSDTERLKARLAHARPRTEMLFVAMLGNFSDDADHDANSYKEILTKIQSLVRGEPRTGNLLWQYAAYEAEHGDRHKAIDQLQRAFTALPHMRATASGERAFSRLWKGRSFVALISGKKPIKEVSGDPFVQQFDETVKTLLAEPRSFKSALMAELLLDVNGNVLPVPSELVTLSQGAAAERQKVGEDRYWKQVDSGFVEFASQLWMALAKERTLFASRAEALARAIVLAAATPVAPLQLAANSDKQGWTEAAAILRKAITRLRPAFDDPAPKIDTTFLPIPSVETSQDGFFATFYESGHLQEAGTRHKKKLVGPRLQLDEQPGSGRFQHEGSQGGSGFVTDERYVNGAVEGTFNSPWHDGESYREVTPFALWAGQCLNSIATFAGKLTG